MLLPLMSLSQHDNESLFYSSPTTLVYEETNNSHRTRSSTVQGESTERHYVLVSGNGFISENRITNIVKHHRQTSSARAASNLPII